MQDWEFLLQKEGEESWLPIVDRDLELVEGKYRLVGFCRQPDLEVEIRVTFQSLEEGKFLRRSQRSRRTDSQGLVVVMPYTDLAAGAWEFYCSQSYPHETSPQVTPEILTIQVRTASEYEIDPESEKETIEPYFTSELTEELTEDSPSISSSNEASADRDAQKSTEKSSEIHLFNPRKVEVEAKQVTPLAGQIIPPKIPGADNSDPILSPQLPKFSIPQVEAYIASAEADDEELYFIDLEEEEEGAIDEAVQDMEREESWIDEQFQSLNLKEKFWSRINDIRHE